MTPRKRQWKRDVDDVIQFGPSDAFYWLTYGAEIAGPDKRLSITYPAEGEVCVEESMRISFWREHSIQHYVSNNRILSYVTFLTVNYIWRANT